jgi:pyruvate dehydrogenase E2 component (dihydrolipoamide acetyltransferase)
MATPIVMPRQGNSVESCIIVEWKKHPGDEVAEGEALCEVETDKAVMEVESPVGGTVLDLFYQEGDLVPVLETIAAVGAPGEDVRALRPSDAGQPDYEHADVAKSEATAVSGESSQERPAPPVSGGIQGISPRARNLAAAKAVELTNVTGTGPGGRIIERDVEAALAASPRLSPVAKAMVASGEYQAPARGSGVGGRVMSRDLTAAESTLAEPAPPSTAEAALETGLEPSAGREEAPVTVVPVQGVRRVIAERMRESLLSTAQLTMNRSVVATGLLDYRRRLKASDPALGLQGVTINDLVLFVTARTLARFPDVNALYIERDGKGEIHQYGDVHLAFAVDTPRGLIVPVIRYAHRLSLRALAMESNRLAGACLAGSVLPDEITGGTFTVTNLGSLGVESFTPILNPPQVGILGVGGIVQRPVAQEDGGYTLAPHLNLSLTINHQVVDGAPGARFLASIAQGIAEIDLVLAL